MEENVLYVKTLKKRDIVANMDKNKLFVECDCYTHAIVVDRTDEDAVIMSIVYLSLKEDMMVNLCHLKKD